MSKSVFTNVNTLSQIFQVPGSLPYENPEADWMEEEQGPSWKNKKEVIFFVKKVAGELFPFRLMVKNKPWHFK